MTEIGSTFVPIRQFERLVFVSSALLAVACIATTFIVGCPAAPGSLGVTAGGQQDVAAFRRAVDLGDIPNPAAMTVEGLLSEHSIEVALPDDPGLLYATATAAWNQDYDEFTPLATIAVGFGTTIDAATFRRRPLNLCLVIDRSGSMNDAIDSRTRVSKLTAVKIAVDRLLAKLTADDLVSIVVFNDTAQTRARALPGNDAAAIKLALDDIEATGATDIARGMLRGYSLLQTYTDPSRSDRLFVFTDALPTEGATTSEGLISVMLRHANRGAGASFFALGVDFGAELAYDISQIRGGNYFFLGDYERIISVFDELDYLVTPVAFDVQLRAIVPFALDVHDVYGLPEVDTNTHILTLTLPSLFLSSRQGGGVILIRLRAGALVDFTAPVELAAIRLSYQTPEGITVTSDISASLPAGLDPRAATSWFETDGTKRAVLLANTALALRRSAEDMYSFFNGYYYYDFYGPDSSRRQRAAARLSGFLPYFDTMAEGLADQPDPESRTLSGERAMVQRLLINLTGR